MIARIAPAGGTGSAEFGTGVGIDLEREGDLGHARLGPGHGILPLMTAPERIVEGRESAPQTTAEHGSAFSHERDLLSRPVVVRADSRLRASGLRRSALATGLMAAAYANQHARAAKRRR
jgi:hypothetical protein